MWRSPGHFLRTARYLVQKRGLGMSYPPIILPSNKGYQMQHEDAKACSVSPSRFFVIASIQLSTLYLLREDIHYSALDLIRFYLSSIRPLYLDVFSPLFPFLWVISPPRILFLYILPSSFFPRMLLLHLFHLSVLICLIYPQAYLVGKGLGLPP